MRVVLLEKFGKQKAGKIVDLPDEKAHELIGNGDALPIDQPELEIDRSTSKRGSTKRSNKK